MLCHSKDLGESFFLVVEGGEFTKVDFLALLLVEGEDAVVEEIRDIDCCGEFFCVGIGE